jgi:G3E family GTPase
LIYEMKKRTNIIILSGFLGSGKTTLLKRFIDWEFSRGNQPLVIMCEFGDFDIDSQILEDERLQISSVVGGCICCTNRNELFYALQNIIKNNPGSPVYIETTGVGDPAGVLQGVSPVLDSDVKINKVIVVYDAGRYHSNDNDSILIEKQLMTSDIIVLNKTDLGSLDIKKIENDIAKINPNAEIIRSVECNIDLDAALRGTTGCFAESKETDSTDNYRSFAFKIETRLLRDEFEEWLGSLPSDIIRLKGFVRFQSENGIFEVQYSRGNHRIRLFETSRWMDASLVIISHPINPDVILDGFKSCIPVKED